MNKFITFEGIDGAGKSTLASRLNKWLVNKNIPVLLTQEPTNSKFGQQIKHLLLDTEIQPQTEFILYTADRIEHIKTLIEPELKTDKFVICDRYLDSSLAYQDYGQDVDISWMESINQNLLLPEVTFLIDIPAQVGLKRQKYQQKFEQLGVEFLEKVRFGYLQIAQKEPGRIITLDGLQSTDILLGLVVEKIEQKYLNISK